MSYLRVGSVILTAILLASCSFSPSNDSSGNNDSGNMTNSGTLSFSGTNAPKTSQECEKLENSEKVEQCKNRILLSSIIAKKDFSACSTLPNKEMAGSCYVMIAVKNQMKDKGELVNPCGSIADKDTKTICEDLVNMNLATNKTDAKICEKVVNDDKRTICKKIVEERIKKKQGIK